jgi:flagellar hook-basal body complex protein FliE
MDSIESIAAYSTAMSQAQLQNAVAIKVMKMAQGSDKMVGDMLTQALDTVRQSMEATSQTTGGIDTYA